MPYELTRFTDKFLLALESDIRNKPPGGLCGFELEWNLLDSHFRPLLTVGSGPSQLSFVDFLRSECLSPRLRTYSQLEVFHWMIEWATRPYFSPRGAVYEGRLMEAVLIDALHKAGQQFGTRLFTWPGNLPTPVEVGRESIPGSWHLAKRRYLERCVDLYGESLATAGNHTNLSLPDALLEWDFVHLPPDERITGGLMPMHLDEFKSQFYITATRLMRAFAALFIATNASTPLKPGIRAGHPVALLTGTDSVRNLTFPNPAELDLPDLYRSYADYLQFSYDLVQRGIRFGNNNWTPVRARSFAEPVERLIAVTSEQLNDLYARGLYSAGQDRPVEEMARQVEVQNLLARINLPMARVEVRTDDGGHPIEVDIANLTIKYLLLVRFYADPEFARAFRYDREDIQRARRNEEKAALEGLRAVIENPLTGKPIEMRSFLSWTLEEVRPLAEALGWWDDLEPLQEMAAGGPNTAERLRNRIFKELGLSGFTDDSQLIVPLEILRGLAEEREIQVQQDVEAIAETLPTFGSDYGKLSEFLQYAREDVRLDPYVPIRFRPRPEALIEVSYTDKTSEILAMARELISIPSVTASPEERLDEVRRAATFIFDYLRNQGLGVRYYNQSPYPALLAGFPGQMNAPVMLSGHFDVVEPEPDDSQFEARVDGDYLWGRGAADMKTVVATYLVWMKDMLRLPPPYPPLNLLLVGNEENGETEPMGTPHALKMLVDDGYEPQILVAGERTGEKGDERWGEICTQNRGVMRFDVVVRGQRGHSGVAAPAGDLTERLFATRQGIMQILGMRLTLNSPDGWSSQVRFPFIMAGTPGVYNITADRGRLGVEVRSIPQDDLSTLFVDLQEYCHSQDLELSVSVMENGISCDPDNPYLVALIEAVRKVSGDEPQIGRKLPGTSARFAPRGQGVVWGQSGIGPHARDERHYIPSILPYYQALCRYGDLLKEKKSLSDERV
jgi:succinyl-diaminopimelate desuccinylase